jgi:hypothetical protein
MSWSNNSAAYAQVIYTDKTKSAVLVDNCTIADCVVVGWDAAVKANYSDRIFPITGKATVRNTLIYNVKRDDGTQIPDLGSTYWCRNFKRSASDYGLSGENNILLTDGSLKFRKPAKDNYTVVSGPTINAGELLSWHAGSKDLLGRDRVIGGAPDIGCYEFDPKEIPGTRVILR